MIKIFRTLLFFFLSFKIAVAGIVSEDTIRSGERAIQIGVFRDPGSIQRIKRIFPAYDLLIREAEGLRKIYIVHLSPRDFGSILRLVRKKIPSAFPVRLEPLSTSSSHPVQKRRPKKEVPQRASYFIQVGTFSSQTNAQKALHKLGNVDGKISRSGNLYSVIIPGFSTLKEAKKALNRFKKDFSDAFIALGTLPPVSRPPVSGPRNRSSLSKEKKIASPVFKVESPSKTPPVVSGGNPRDTLPRKRPILKEETIPLNSETILKTRKKFY